MKYQLSNLFHNILSKKQYKLIVNTIHSHSFYDISIQDLDDFIFIDHETINKNTITYGITAINDPMLLANNIEYIKSMYSNKAIFFHHNIFDYLKKEDQYLLFNYIKNYALFSFVPELSINSNNINYINYGFNNVPFNETKNRKIDVLIVYRGSSRSAEILRTMILQQLPHIKVDILDYSTLKSSQSIIETLSNTKVCIDLASYYNVLLSVSCGCYGITKTQYNANNEFVQGVQDMGQISEIVNHIITNKYSDTYIESAQKYIEINYPYETFKSSIINIFQNLVNSAIIP